MKYLILGAGPSGLSFANALLKHGISDFLVLEAEDVAGGLCRSEIVDGSPIDIGGGHFLDIRRPAVNQFLFQFMPENEWQMFERNSQILIHGQSIHHPFESNIWEFDLESQIRYLKSIASAGCNTGQKMPQKFTEWITWKLGSRIARDYMIPYNQKMFGTDLDDLGTYWLEKLPDVSFENTLRSCLMKKAYGTQPGHAKFYYPKRYGYGELWKRMADALGSKIQYGKKIRKIDFDNRAVIDERGMVYSSCMIINTIPWSEFQSVVGMPNELKESIQHLKYSSIQIDYQEDSMETDAHWIYIPDMNKGYHRILVRHNFCIGSRGYWTETNGGRLGLNNVCSSFHYFNKFAYPLNTRRKPEVMKKLLEWSMAHGVYGLGRWGEHHHYNSDAVVERALSLANKLEMNGKTGL